MAGPLATPTFVSRPDDKLAAVDVYTKKDSAVVNNIKDVLTSPVTTSGLLSSLRGGNSALATLTAKTVLGGAITKGLATDAAGALSRLGMTGAAKALSALTPALTAVVTAKIASSGLSNIKATVSNAAGQITRIGVGNLTALNSVNKAVSGWTGVSTGMSLQDNAAIAGFASSLVTTGIQNGSSGFLTSLKGQLSNPYVMQSVVKEILPSVNKSGNIGALREIHDVAPGVITTVSKDPIGDFSCSYPDPTVPLSTYEYKENFDNMKSTFSDINPGWTTSTRVVDNGFDENGFPLTKPDPAFDISKINNSTPEFKKTVGIGAMTSTDPNDKMLLVANEYDGKSVQDKAQSLYPAAFVNSEEKKATNADPSAVAMNENVQAQEMKSSIPMTASKVYRSVRSVQTELDMMKASKADDMDERYYPKLKAAEDYLAAHSADDEYQRLKQAADISLKNINWKYDEDIAKLEQELAETKQYWGAQGNG